MIYVCKSKDGEEIDGFERHVQGIIELLKLLEEFKEAHIQTKDEEIDLWVKVE